MIRTVSGAPVAAAGPARCFLATRSGTPSGTRQKCFKSQSERATPTPPPSTLRTTDGQTHPFVNRKLSNTLFVD